mgnify:CR=1 FL=1
MTGQPKSAYASKINWIAFIGGMYAFLSLCAEFYTSGKIDIDENTSENLFYFTASVCTYVFRTFTETKPVYMTKKQKARMSNELR